LDLKDIPVYNQDDETNTPYSVKLLKEKIRNADLIFITTPEYNHSISGVLKNAIDWLSRPSSENLFEWKTVAVLSASTGMIGGARAQEDLKRIMEPLGAIIVPRPEVILTSADKKFDSNGHITDQIAVQLMSSLIKNSIRLSLALKNSANVETLANIIYKS
ncbi:MAG: NADPH-dependent FMN reductase, partial [Nitrososphaeria archaeon]